MENCIFCKDGTCESKAEKFKIDYLTSKRNGKAVMQIQAMFQQYCKEHIGKDVEFRVTDCDKILKLEKKNNNLALVLETLLDSKHHGIHEEAWRIEEALKAYKV